MLEQAQRSVLATGPAVFVGSVGADGTVDCVRSFGAHPTEASDGLRLLFPEGAADSLLANIAAGSVIAVSFADILTFETYQAKGPVVTIEEANDTDRAKSKRAFDMFCSRGISVGIPESCRRCRHEAATAVVMYIEQLYCQTPGAEAGTRVRGEKS